MKSTQIKKDSSFLSFIHSVPALGVFVLITFYTSTILYTQWKKERVWYVRVVEKEEQVKALRVQHDVLKARVAYAESEAGKEEYLRQSFDVAHKGESLVILPETKKEPVLEDTSLDIEQKPWWQNFMAKIFNL